jgi:hypothetical protein
MEKSMESQFDGLSEELRKEITRLWQSGALDALAKIIRDSFPQLKQSRFSLSLEFGVTYASLLQNHEDQLHSLLARMVTSVSFSDAIAKDIIEKANEDVDLRQKEEVLLGLHDKGMENPSFRLHFEPIRPRAKGRTCKTCGGVGYVPDRT